MGKLIYSLCEKHMLGVSHNAHSSDRVLNCQYKEKQEMLHILTVAVKQIIHGCIRNLK